MSSLSARPRRLSLLLAGAVVLLAAAAMAGTLLRAAAAQPPPSPGWEERGAAGAIANLEYAMQLDAQNERAYRLLEQAYLANGDRSAAGAVWQRAAAANPLALWAWQQLAEAERSSGNYAAGVLALEQAAALAPHDKPLAAALEHQKQLLGVYASMEQFWASLADKPQDALFTSVDRSLDGWTLVGYYADSAALVRGEQSPVWAFWLAPGTQEVPHSDLDRWRRLGPRLWLHTAGEVSNLLYDGDFEISGRYNRVLGLPNDLYNADPSTRQIAQVRRFQSDTFAAALQTNGVNTHASYVSRPIPVDTNKVYLQSGLVRSVDANGFLGWRWFQQEELRQEEYVEAPADSGLWQPVQQFGAPPPGAESMETALLNIRSNGTVYFDDLLLLPFERPQQSAEGSGQPAN